jgi:hypothetical protein
MLDRRAVSIALILLSCIAGTALAEDSSAIRFPEGYRSWYLDHTTVALQGTRRKTRSAYSMSMQISRPLRDSRLASSTTARSWWSTDLHTWRTATRHSAKAIAK